MDIYDLLIENLGMCLSMANRTLTYWIDMPANSTGPLDTSITLTAPGEAVVWEMANAAIQMSQMLVEFLASLFW